MIIAGIHKTDHSGSLQGNISPRRKVSLDEHFASICDGKDLFIRDWFPVIEAVANYWNRAFKYAGEPKKASGEPNWYSRPLQERFAHIFRETHPAYAEWFLSGERKNVRQAVREIGLHLDEVLDWYNELPEERREALTYPPNVWSAWKAANTPTGKNKANQNHETIAELHKKLDASESENAALKEKVEAVFASVPADILETADSLVLDPSQRKMTLILMGQRFRDGLLGIPGGDTHAAAVWEAIQFVEDHL